MNKLFLLLGIIAFAVALDIQVGSSKAPKHAFTSSQLSSESVRNARSLVNSNEKRESDTDFIDAYLERATICTNSTNYRVCSQGNATFASGNKNYQHDLIFNPLADEYFLVYVQESNSQTALLGQRMDDKGNPLGQVISVVSYGDVSGPKHNPRVAYSENDDVYFVVFDYISYDIDGNPDEDVAGMFIAGNGTKIGEPFYVGSSVYLPGDDHHIRVTYNTFYNYFIVAHQHTQFGDTDIILQAIPLEGVPYYPWILGSSFDDSQPDITYNPNTNLYYLVFQTGDSETIDVWGVSVSVTGEPVGNFSLIGDTTHFDGTQVKDHNPIIIYEETHMTYLVVFEVDLQGNDEGPTNIIGRRLNSDGIPENGFAYIGDQSNSDGTYNKNPDVAYGIENDEYVVTYESFLPNTEISTIRASVVNADDLNIKQDLLISDAKSNEYFPAVGHDTQQNTYLVMWSHGDPVVNTSAEPSTGSATVDSGKKVNKGAIVGGVFGALFGVAIVAGIIIYIRKRSKTKSYELHSLNE